MDVSKFQSDKKIEDEEILKLLEQPIARNTGNKKKKPKKKAAKKTAAKSEEDDEDESEE